MMTEWIWWTAAIVLIVTLVGMTVLTLHFAIILAIFRQFRRTPPDPAAPFSGDDPPRVLVQIPLYNERNVVERIVRAAAAQDWPRHRLSIQVLDDSTDSTPAIAADLVETLRASGTAIRHIRRAVRTGYKAGALAYGLSLDDAPYVAILDADFVPDPDFLRRTVGPLLSDPGLGFVQARWDHQNAGDSLLTEAQSMMLDAAFAVEQPSRSFAGLVLPFNGTCGVWRREAIRSAGGWSLDVLTEDLDLSIRAQLRHWRARYLVNVAVPGELPGTLAAWRTQQFRWTKGFAQVARKLLPAIWASDLSLKAKAALTLQLGQCLFFPLASAALISSLTMQLLAGPPSWPFAVLGGLASTMGLCGMIGFLTSGHAVLHRGGGKRLAKRLPLAFLFGSGLLVSNTRAALEGLAGRPSAFIRTPKRGSAAAPPRRYRVRGASGVGELVAAAVLLAIVAAEQRIFSPLLLPTITGLVTVGLALAREHVAAARDIEPASD
jgi:cellulose synthase/poly-beta-1,6-N-acetylglucosamine synthase-like glycosyltransferase